MVFFLRTIVILAALGIAWFSYLKHVEDQDRTLRIQDLRDCLDRREFANSQPEDAARKHFLQFIHLLQESQNAEASLGWWKTKDRTVEWYLAESLKVLDANEAETELIRKAILETLGELQAQNAFSIEEKRNLLPIGRLPDSATGLFEGDPQVIGYRLSPLVFPQLRNHPGNFILQPATAWALQQDIAEIADLALAHEFVKARQLPESAYQAVHDQLIPPSRTSTARKND